MKQKFKQRSSKKLVNMDSSIDIEKFITPDPKKLYRDVRASLKVMHGRIIQKALETCCTSSYSLNLDGFLDIDEEV